MTVIRGIQFLLPILSPLCKWVSAMQTSPGVIPYTFWTALNSKYERPYVSICVEDNAVGRFLSQAFPQVCWIEAEYDPYQEYDG